jgi:hypothetical protein
MKEYRITCKKQLKAFYFIFYLALFIIGVLSYYLIINELSSFYLKYLITWFIISLAPVVFLHIDYLQRNRNYKFTIDRSNTCFIFYDIKKSETSIIKFEDIEQIIIFCAPSIWERINIYVLPFEKYHFGRIYTKSQKQYNVTNLLMEDIIDEFKHIQGLKVIYQRRIFATTLY